MTERRTPGMQQGPSTIKIPRIAIAPPSNQLTGMSYMSPHISSTFPRNTDILTSPSYVADHLPSRRLSEIDSPYYIPNFLSNQSAAYNTPIRSPYATTPLRIRTDVNTHPRYLDTATDTRGRALTSEDNRTDYIRFSEYPATSAVIGLQPPRMLTPLTRSAEPSEAEKRSNHIVAESNEDVDRLALFNNTSLAYQRICYIMTRYPAVAMCIISTWMLWGRGLGLNSVAQNENVAYIMSFTAGVFILSSQILLTTPHNNSYKREKILANLYHFSNTIVVLLAITIIVFAAISFQSVQKVNQLNDTCTFQDGVSIKTCFTPNEREIFLSVLIGASAFVIALSFFSGIYGCVGQALMKKKRQDEYRVYAESHDTAAFRF